MSRFDVDWDEMEDLRVVAPFFEELRAEFAEGPAPRIGTELATLFVFGAPPVAVVTPPTASSRSRIVRRVAAGTVGGLALVGGMGAAGALPGPIQDPVAKAASYVGLNLPRPHHHHRPDKPTSDSQTNGEVTRTSTPRAHNATHVPSADEPTLLSPDGAATPTTGATTAKSGTTTSKSGSGSSSSTGNSSVTGSGSAVSSTSSDTHNGTNQNGGRRPTYHGNGRTTRDDRSSTSTTTPPADDSGTSGSGTPSGDSGSTTPSTSPPTTAAS